MMRKAIARWAILAVGVPVAAAGARKLGQAVEARRGPSSKAGRLLRKGADLLQSTRPARRSRFGRW